MKETAPARPRRRRLRRALRWIGLACGALGAAALIYFAVLWATLPSIAGLGEHGDPGPTAFMAEARCPGGAARQWRPLDRIDPRLGCAVVWAEDTTFFRHHGVDWDAVWQAARADWRARRVRYGASTLPMQLARNLYLSRGRTLTRKLREMLLARRLVARYDRLRLLEVYLNSAEFAPCVYGAEAAARHYFGHGAGTLDLAEATLLAAMLPRPSIPPGRDAADTRRLRRKQKRLLHRFRRAGLLSPRDLYAASHDVDLLWSRPLGQHLPTAPGPASRRFYERECGTARLLGPPQ